MVLNYLRTLQQQGVERLPVDEEARAILRSWMLAARNGATTPATQPTPPPNTGKATHTTAPAPDSVEEKLAYLQMRAQNWKAARALGTLRDTMVFATGNPHARLMLVGEAPGYDEERLQPWDKIRA